MARNKHIRQADVDAIVAIVRGWDEEVINWVALCKSSQSVLGYLPSRSGLSAHKNILEAFQARKAGLKVAPPPKTALPSSLAAAAIRLNAKDAEIAELKRKNNLLHEQFTVWLYNARSRMTIEQLNQPLPVIDRTQTGDAIN
jgi:hypothetical protein